MSRARWLSAMLLVASGAAFAEEPLRPRATLLNQHDVKRLYFSPSGATIYASGFIWDSYLTGTHEAYESKRAGLVAVENGCLSPDLEIAANVDSRGQVMIAGPGGFLHATHGTNRSDRRIFPLSMAISPDRRWLALGCIDGNVELWEALTDKRPAPEEPTETPRLQAPDGSVVQIEFAPDSGLLVVAVDSTRTRPAPNADLRIQFWDPPSQRLVRRGAVPGAVFYLCRSGQALAAWKEQDVAIVETATGGKRCTFAGKITTAALSADGRFLATGDPEDDTIHLRDLSRPQTVLDLKAHRHRVTALAFSPDGKTLASASDGTVHLWDLPTPRHRSEQLKEEELETAWKELADHDAGRAFEAITRLSRAPGVAIPFLTEKLQETSLIDQNQIKRLIAGLDSDDFEVREKSSLEISKLMPFARPHLEKTLRGGPSLEIAARIRTLLALPVTSWLAIEPVPPGALRALRAVEALEVAGTTEARQALEDLAKGSPAEKPARAALKRLGAQSGR